MRIKGNIIIFQLQLQILFYKSIIIYVNTHDAIEIQ